MRTVYILCMLAIAWLACTAKVNSGLNCTKVNVAKVKTTLSTAFSFSNDEIELTSIQVFAPVHKTVEKKEPSLFPVSVNRAAASFYNTKAYLSKLLTIISGNSFNLLYPFHYFW